MKLKFTIVIGLLVIWALTACSKGNTNPDIIGYVVANDDQRILVVSQLPQDFSENGGVSEYFDAIYLSNVPENVKVGQLVKVWYEGAVAESYPMQGKIGDLEIIETTKPEGANLTEAEAIQKAIEKQSTPHLAIKSITFEKETKMWKIELKELLQDKVTKVEIGD